RARLLCTKRATITAIPANFALLATHDVTRHGGRMPAQRAQSALQYLFARRHSIVLKVHRKPRANRIETTRVLFAHEPWHTRGRPFSANIVGRSKRCAVVDYRAASQALSGSETDTLLHT